MTHIDKVELDAALAGRWGETLRTMAPEFTAAIDAAPRHVRCPLPDHDDNNPSFRFSDLDAGRAICNCGNYDGYGLLMQCNGWGFGETLRHVANQIGFAGAQANGQSVDALAAVCRYKSLTESSARAYGAKVAGAAVSIPVFDVEGRQCSTFTIWPTGNERQMKGMLAKGKPAGVFMPVDEVGKPRMPDPGEVVLIAYSGKDAIALHALGHYAIGLPGCELSRELVAMFRGMKVLHIPHRNSTEFTRCERNCKRLIGTAASVYRVDLPLAMDGEEGDDVRDLLRKPNGKTLLRRAIETATLWERPKPAEIDAPSIWQPDGRTDTANAKRFIAMHGDDIRWCDLWGKWLAWDGKRWRPDHEKRVEGLAKNVSVQLFRELAVASENADASGALREMMNFAKASANARGIFNMLTLAKSEPSVPILPEKLDADPWAFNVEDGTIDLQAGTIRGHVKADLITKISPVVYQRKATCPIWLAFLDTVLDGDDSMICFLQRLVGYSLAGVSREHVLPLLYGTGANGKSTFLNTIEALFGENYGMKAPPELLMAKKGAGHPTERADLHGKRFVAAIETEESRRLAESLVKELTGGDRIRARRMREDFWQFTPSHTIWLATNHKPTIRGNDHGIWRRVKLLPFTVVIPDDQQDKALSEKLVAELPGILNWAIQGCLDWQADGLREPDTVSVATNNYRAEMDVIGQFLDERCLVGGTLTAGAKELFEAYKSWCDDANERPLTQKSFGGLMSERGFKKERISSGAHKGRQAYVNLGILDNARVNDDGSL